jgi:endonuclease/exonuclease/phosphatase family metal-dependent hydrolase
MTSLSVLKVGAVFTIDHIFHTPDIRIANFQVVKEPIVERASDHYPICTELII